MTTATRYHMSPKRHAVGDLLTGNGKPKVDPVVEKVLEDRRPPGSLSRLDAVFTVEIPDFRRLGIDCGYIYRVEIGLPAQLHDTSWLGRLRPALQ